MEGKDELTGLLQERFAGHELPVDPTIWEGVQAQLVETAMNADLDLFRDRFSGHEAPVDPGIWQGIAGQLGHGAAAGTAAGGGLLGGAGGWIATGIVAVAITGGLWWWSATPEPASSTPTRTEALSRPTSTPTLPATEELQEAAVEPVEGPAPGAERPSPAEVAQRPDTDGATGRREDGAQPPDVPMEATTSGEQTGEAAPDPRQQPVPATLQPRLTSSDTGVQDPHGMEVVQRILGEAVSETAQHPRPEQEEAIPPAPVPVPDQDVEEETAGQDAPETPADIPADELTLFIPNVFSPNNDLVNDELRVQGEGFQEVRVRIYNANNNQLVFAAESLKPWDGRDLSGQPCPDGFYFYAIEAVDLGGRLHTKGQAVRLFR